MLQKLELAETEKRNHKQKQNPEEIGMPQGHVVLGIPILSFHCQNRIKRQNEKELFMMTQILAAFLLPPAALSFFIGRLE